MILQAKKSPSNQILKFEKKTIIPKENPEILENQKIIQGQVDKIIHFFSEAWKIHPENPHLWGGQKKR